jgi:hypothetical protein
MPSDDRPDASDRDDRHCRAGEIDELPADLDVTHYVGVYQFPDVRRRRIAGAILIGAALACAWAWQVSDNGGLLAAAALFVVLGAYHFAAAWPLAISQTDALAVASATVGFPVGHSSARVMFRGVRSRPVWQVLLYSADEPPTVRGLVELDAVSGTVLGEYTETNPEDWSGYNLGPDVDAGNAG